MKNFAVVMQDNRGSGRGGRLLALKRKWDVTLVIPPMTKAINPPPHCLKREALTSSSLPTPFTKPNLEIEHSSTLRALPSTTSPEVTSAAPRTNSVLTAAQFTAETLILESGAGAR